MKQAPELPDQRTQVASGDTLGDGACLVVGAGLALAVGGVIAVFQGNLEFGGMLFFVPTIGLLLMFKK